jgi:hypothetical protein
MPRFAVVSRERHGRAKWLRFNGYAFAAACPSSDKESQFRSLEKGGSGASVG